MPGGRKTCGFLGHSANFACTKCLKLFPDPVGSKDYSGFDRDHWKSRNMEDHRKAAFDLKCKTQSELTQKQSEAGYWYSVLLRLSYFDPTRFLIVDPMHNCTWALLSIT